MFRENEASRVGAVLEAQAAGDVTAMVQAALHAWIAPEEAQGSSETFATTWGAIAARGAEAQAVAAFVNATREGSRCRPAIFVRLTEEIAEIPTLVELAGIVLDAGWDASPYLAAVFARLAERNAKVPLETFLSARKAQLAARADTWLLVAFTLTTTNAGDRHTVDAWFDGWEQRPGVPCWIIAAYAASILQVYQGPGSQLRIRGLARQVPEATVPDATAAFFDSFRLHDELRGGVTTEHIPMIRERCAAILAFLLAPRIDLPLTRYANAAKSTRPIVESDFMFSRPVSGTDVVFGGVLTLGSAIAKSQARPPDWRLVELCQELPGPCARIVRIAPLFADLLETPRGSPRAVELARQMQKARPAELPGLRRHWKRLLAERIPFLKRVAMTFR